MPSGTFVPFQILSFPTARAEMRTVERRPRGSRDEQADPVYTQIAFRDGRVAGFGRAEILHRKGVQVEGFWHGYPITEIVEQKTFDAYYKWSRNDRLFIAQTEKEVALSAADALSKEFRDVLNLETVTIDFRQIIATAVDVTGSWFKGMRHPNIKCEAAFGYHINRDPEFLRLCQIGNHSNIVAIMSFGTEMLKVNISKIGSVYFMDDHPVETCLRFVEHLQQYRIVPAAAQAR